MQQLKGHMTTVILLFQSMHPIKDATKTSVGNIINYEISIHAPYKGCNH